MPTQGGAILVAEDEILVRQIGIEILEDKGYRVLEAASAEEALLILERAPGMRLLFTDIRMPGTMDGLGLAKAVHERWPQMRLLLTSGHCRLDPDEIPDSGHFLSKPYRRSQLLHQIAQCSLGIAARKTFPIRLKYKAFCSN